MSKAARALLKKINDKKNAIRGLQGQGNTGNEGSDGGTS